MKSPSAPPGSLGDVLHQARVRAGLSLRAAAHGTGLSYTTLHRIESGERDTAPLEALFAVGDKLGVARATTAALAKGPGGETARSLADARAARAVRGGSLTRAARAALRRVHIADLLADVASRCSSGTPTLDELEAVMSMRWEPSTGDPGFHDDGVYAVPPQSNPNERVAQRGWRAHGLAHSILATETGEPPACLARAQQVDSEREATYLAGHILIPTARLMATHRRSPLGPLLSGDEVGAGLDELMSDFDVLPALAAARLAEESLLVELPL